MRLPVTTTSSSTGLAPDAVAGVGSDWAPAVPAMLSSRIAVAYSGSTDRGGEMWVVSPSRRRMSIIPPVIVIDRLALGVCSIPAAVPRS